MNHNRTVAYEAQSHQYCSCTSSVNRSSWSDENSFSRFADTCTELINLLFCIFVVYSLDLQTRFFHRLLVFRQNSPTVHPTFGTNQSLPLENVFTFSKPKKILQTQIQQQIANKMRKKVFIVKLDFQAFSLIGVGVRSRINTSNCFNLPLAVQRSIARVEWTDYNH